MSLQVMTAASVPSTLVKCLYLFFDLPDCPEVGQTPVWGSAESRAWMMKYEYILEENNNAWLPRLSVRRRLSSPRERGECCYRRCSCRLALLEMLSLSLCQVLLRLCAHVAAVEELARKDDLTLLFSAIR